MRKHVSTLSILATVLLFSGLAAADPGLRFGAKLSRSQAVPAPEGGQIEAARVRVRFSEDLSEAHVRLTIEGGENVVAAHFHCARPGQGGPVAFGLFSPGPFLFDGEKAEGVLTNDDFTGGDCMESIGRPVSNIAGLAFAMRDGLIYLNVHTSDNFPGEVRGQLLEQRRPDLPFRDRDRDRDED